MKRALSICTPAEWFCLLVLALPWLIAPWPMGTDLPQHAAQINLLARAWAGDPELGIAWFGANNLVYWPLALAIWTFGPVGGTKVLSWLLVSAAAFLSFRLCRSRGTPLAYAIVAAVFLFNSNLYWGLISFQMGWVVYLGWLILMLSPAPNTPRRVIVLAAVHFLLLAAHSLWFAAAGLSGIVLLVLRPATFRTRLVRGLSALPAAVLALAWIPGVREQRELLGFDVEAHWFVGFPERLSADFLWTGAFGNVTGSYLVVIAIVTLAALLAARWLDDATRATAPPQAGPDRELLGLAALAGVALFVLPDGYLNTIDFARRWAPYALILLLLSRSVRRLPVSWSWAEGFPRALRLATLAPIVACSLWTASAWSSAARKELSGLEDALDAIGTVDAPRTLGLSRMTSRRVLGLPYLQLYAWSQALHGGTLNFSFTEHQSGIVFDRNPAPPPWTDGLEWEPENVTDGDLRFFDVVLIGAGTKRHALFAEHANLEPMTSTGIWRAYRVNDSLPR